MSNLCKVFNFLSVNLYSPLITLLTGSKLSQHFNNIKKVRGLVLSRISCIMIGKGKAVPLHAIEALGGRGGIAPTHSRPRHYIGVSGQRHASAVLLPPGKEPPVPIVQEAGWAPEGHRG
jgi:hypothetical protein